MLRGWTLSQYKKRGPAAVCDVNAARDCILRCVDSTRWDWASGSWPLFWRWPLEYQAAIRDGIELRFKGPVSRWHVPQQAENDTLLVEGIRKKLSKVRDRGYIGKGRVESLTSFFAIPKGELDIRMVYDGMKSRLNGTLWVPWFSLSTVEQHLRATVPGSYMGDVDIGEMFLNFMLHESVWPYCGVDLTSVFPGKVDDGQVLWERWERCGMGFTTSPYQAVQGVMWAEEFILGDQKDPVNPFWYD